MKKGEAMSSQGYLKVPINAFRPAEPGNMEYLKLDCHR